jgi:hypothetical protein
MFSAKVVIGAILTVIAIAACGGSVQPASPAGSTKLVSRGRVDDPRTAMSDHVACLRQARLPVQEIGSTQIQIGPPSVGPMVLFVPTDGAAQADQIQGAPRYQGAEVIGSALLYPNQASDAELGTVEACLTQGVKG